MWAGRRTLELAGPAFIKWGQWAATRQDLFPPDMCAELSHLHSSAPAHSYAHTQRSIRSAFGVEVGDLFECFEEEPLASGSIGQIHRARLSNKGARHTGVPAGQLSLSLTSTLSNRSPCLFSIPCNPLGLLPTA